MTAFQYNQSNTIYKHFYHGYHKDLCIKTYKDVFLKGEEHIHNIRQNYYKNTKSIVKRINEDYLYNICYKAVPYLPNLSQLYR